jgi:hypothetical protein
VSDITTTTLLVGLAVALAEAVKWMAKAFIVDRTKRNGNHKSAQEIQSGQLTPEEWEGRFERVMRKVLTEFMPRRK